MKFDEYQVMTRKTAVYPGHGMLTNQSLMYLGLGLNGEAGEIADIIKKIVRDGNLIDIEAIGKELGDVLWYVAQAADLLGLSLSDVATGNIRKLRSRQERGVLAGSGDDR